MEPTKARKMFLDALGNWQEKLKENEYYFAKLIEKIIDALKPQEAYSQIVDVLKLADEQAEEFLFVQLLWLSESLIRKSASTKAPDGIVQVLDKLSKKADNIKQGPPEVAKGSIQEIKNLYQIK